MKQIVFLLLVPFFGFTQQAYYNDVDLTKIGLELKAELADKIITTHTNLLSYTPGIWEASKKTDIDPSNTEKVFLIYGYVDESVSDNDITNDLTRDINNNGGGQGEWNREHVYPRSLGNPNLESEGPGADAHHLRPSDATQNSDRSNRKFVDGTGIPGILGNNYYPGDQWKGDVARMMMYMYLHYGERCLPSIVGVGDNSGTPDDMIDLFLKWNAEDPVTPFEDQRNTYHDSKETYAQGNRNPFIDNPYLATLIWGGSTAEDRWNINTPDSEAPTTPTNVTVVKELATTININWTASTDNVAVVSYAIFVDGIFNISSTTTEATLKNLNPETTYSITVIAKDRKQNKSAISSVVLGTTTDNGGGNAAELFFSEYIEGSGFNKALEIANFTSNPIDLSTYTIRKQSNGKGSWGTPFNLSGTVAVGDVLVIRHGSDSRINDKLKNEADIIVPDSGASPMNFNGNDAIALFKGETLIDVIGVFNSSNNFGKDETLRRKSNIIKPNIAFDKTGEWNVFPNNTVDGFGQHQIDTSSLSISEFNKLNNIRLYPNPSFDGSVTIEFPSSIEIYTIEVYSITGRLILKKENAVTLTLNNKIKLENPPKGLLLLKLITSQGNGLSKLIVK